MLQAIRDHLKRARWFARWSGEYHIQKRRWLQGMFGRTRLFSHLNIETNNLCTRECSFCWYGVREKQERAVFLKDTLFEKIISELASLDYRGRISLYEINEPLTDKRVRDWIARAARALPRAWHTLTTNGDLLDEGMLTALFEAGLDQLYISAYDPESLEKLRALILRNAQVSEHILLRDYTSVGPFMLDNRAGHIQGNMWEKSGILLPLRRPCERAQTQMIVKPTGKVVCCVADFDQEYVVGDLNSQGLAEVWFGVPFEDLRRHLNARDRTFSPLCGRCDYPGYGGVFRIPRQAYRRKARRLGFR